MTDSSQLLFFFSALGAFNGLLLSVYFAVNAKKKIFSNYFLSLLLLVLSVRVIKSVFFYFNPNLSNIYIQIGLSALILIGPFLYLFLKSNSENQKSNWGIHILPFLIGICVVGTFYSYVDHRIIWIKWIVKAIYWQWFIYIVVSFKYIQPILKKVKIKDSIKKIDIWHLSIYTGTFCIWLAYYIAAYTSYIVGALSFTFILYLMGLLLLFKNSKTSTFFQEKEKYKNKEIDNDTIAHIAENLSILVKKELYLKPNFSLEEAAKEMNVSKHVLSQYLNVMLGKSFTNLINEYRIEKAKELLEIESNLTVEGIGYDSGFSSKSTFFSTFKKITGKTPNEYQKMSLK
ncbi:helix-turn-helix domain-containing protein [Arcicella sp. LKC2W]|uniref:helix-turn-helix domain-containing protein n=1 Tax=Arcicella sp. LKC2W TaxID=2984198 RepID=UPI002B218C2A|nr:helix-turn-helix domain-containing protein [Arcicella sp. LKC2W]MEA5461719.1 helix-turn-helix domain-containing protein [Arcicella sp. LKC2W]